MKSNMEALNNTIKTKISIFNKNLTIYNEKIKIVLLINEIIYKCCD